jgi:hypothetical protein
MSDNEHATAPLWNSEILCIESPPGALIPDVAHCPEEGTKVPSSSRTKEAGDVLEKKPTGAQAFNHAKGVEGQVTARVIQAEALSSDGE